MTNNWDAFRAGDQVAFSRLYEEYFGILYDYGVRHTREKELTIDCLQDFFLYLWNHRENLGEAKSVKYYLISSFRRRLFKYLEKERKIAYRKQDFMLLQSMEHPPAEKKMILAEEQLKRTYLIKELLSELSPRQKEVLYLRYFNGMSPKEIASLMGISYQTVVNHLCEAIKALRQRKLPAIKQFLG